MLLAGLPAGAAAQPVPSRDLNTIVAGGVLRVALTRFDLPAFHWRSDGSFAGPEIELARQIARALGIGVEFIDDATSFDAVVDAVARGQADIGVSKLSQTYYRLLRVRFSDPYITLRHALLFERASIAARSNGRPPDEVLRRFRGRIGAIRASAYVDFGRQNFPDAQIVEMDNWNAAVEDLIGQRLDAIYRDEFEIRRVLKNRPALNVRFGTAVVTDQKGALFLVTTLEDAVIELKSLHRLLDASGRFSFGSADQMRAAIGVEPGAVTPFGALNDTGKQVTVVLDAGLMAHSVINAHPLTNTMTTSLARDDLVKFLRATGHEPRILPVAQSPAG